jgi:hypothetical protein
VHHHFRDALKHSCIVGATHWEARATQHALPGPKPEFFFAPTRIKQRTQDWGPGGVLRQFGVAWLQLEPAFGAWLQVQHARGCDGVAAGYREVLEGRAPPERGHVLALA